MSRLLRGNAMQGKCVAYNEVVAENQRKQMLHGGNNSTKQDPLILYQFYSPQSIAVWEFANEM